MTQANGLSLRGPVLTPGSDGYETHRKVWNGMIDRRPAMIARCSGAADVIAAVNYARERGLTVAVRGGGHSFPGHSVCDDGLMIDLQPMKGIRVDPAAKRVRAEGGVTWGEFDAETQAFGLAVTGGQISHTGIAGLTLGGGFGWLARKHGLVVDNLISCDVVTADGRLLRASADENADLFWGLRGGSGNFGIVTSFEYGLHQQGPVFAGLVAYPLPEASQVLRSYRELAASESDDITSGAFFLTTPDGHKAVGVGLCYAGDDVAAGAKAAEPYTKLGTPVMQQMGPMPYTVVQTMLDAAAVPGRRYYMRSNFLSKIDDGLVQAYAEHYSRVPSPFTAILIVQMGGAIARVASDATAFAHRDAGYTTTVLGAWEAAVDDEANVSWVKALWDDMTPFLTGGVYVNELAEGEGTDRVRQAYGDSHFRRLQDLKRKYDPTNFFHLNPNIAP